MNRRNIAITRVAPVVAIGVALAAFAPTFADSPTESTAKAAAVSTTGHPAAAGESAADKTADRQLADTTKYLASPQLEGRGLGTRGLQLAGDFIARQFKEIGLKIDLYNGQPFEPMTLPLDSEMGPRNHNRLVFTGPPKAGEGKPRIIELKPGADFNPLSVGGSKRFDAPAVFAGYGITAKKEKYDDYVGIDAKGKVVIILRHQPQRSNPHGLFGPHDSEYALFASKIANAEKHGAAAIVFCNDADEIRRSVVGQGPRLDRDKYDPLRGIDRAGESDGSGRLPIVFGHRDAVEQLFKSATGTELATVEKKIDDTGKPQSRELHGWKISGETDLVRQHAQARNVLAELEGDGPHADETIVIGAHYDHLGYGGFGSLAPEAVHVIHPGADDNASGTAALLEVAHRLTAESKVKKFPRRLLFMAFTGEERGLLGSARYVRDPLVPLNKTIAMLNMDMVGRMKDNKLTVYGVDTATEFTPLIMSLNKAYGFKLIKEMGGFGPSDHASFFAKKIPILFFFTGLHADYHRPTDTADKLDVRDLRRVADYVSDIAAAIAEMPERPHFFESPAREEHMMQQGGDRPYFGSIPDFGVESPGGYAISGVSARAIRRPWRP